MLMLMTSLAEKYRRLRHTYGYGVHSPYAYLLLEQIRRIPGYSYYSDNEICNEVRQNEHSKLKKRALMLHRLVARCNIKKVELIGEVPDVYITAIRRGNSSIKISKGASDAVDLIICCHSVDLKSILDKGKFIIAFTEKGADEIIEELGEFPGLMLYGEDFLLLHRRENMAFTKYSVAL